jgi:hypothetical protein
MGNYRRKGSWIVKWYEKIWKKSKLNGDKIWKIRKSIVKIYAKYGKKVRWNLKWYGQHRRKASWIVKWYEKYGRKVSWIVTRYEKYGRNPSWIVKSFGKYGRKMS